MLYSICNRKGITLMEVMVSVVLISVGVMALLSLLPSGLRLAGTSDYLGRAASILQGEMERNEILVMNGENKGITTTLPGYPEKKKVYASGMDTIQPAGDAEYTVETERTDLGERWRVRVWVSWQKDTEGKETKRIYESLIVTRQRYFAQQ